MCGIVAFRGGMLASSVLIEGLKNLEYRGYDSWGMACCDGKLSVVKRVGRISQAEKVSLPGNIGIAHTRWATHGQVTEENSHPHLDCTKSIAVVHNGIIENYQELKRRLASHYFASQTDSEIITHLIEDYIKEHKDGNPQFKLEQFADPDFIACPAFYRDARTWENYIKNANDEEKQKLKNQIILLDKKLGIYL